MCSSHTNDLQVDSLCSYQALVKNHFGGINYLDVHLRDGTFPLPSFPATAGVEGAGVVEKLRPGAEGVAVGDRVAYFYLGSGKYKRQWRIN